VTWYKGMNTKFQGDYKTRDGRTALGVGVWWRDTTNRLSVIFHGTVDGSESLWDEHGNYLGRETSPHPLDLQEKVKTRDVY
jgi:hypothetical protein